MTPIDRFERQLPMALTDLAVPQTPDYLTDILGRTARTRQRPPWASIERWLPVDITTRPAWAPALPWRQLGVLALLAVLLAAMLAVYAGSRTRLPEPFGPAANGVVVYSKGGDIFARDTVTSPSRPLIATAGQEAADSLSPRGTRVLIVTFEGEALHFDVATLAGTDRVHLGGPFLNVEGTSWSPDETSIAIAHEVDGDPAISILQTDGSGMRTLDLGMPANTPAWRPPDGKQLSFRGLVDGNWALFLANADGTGVVQVPVTRDLMEAPYEVLTPAWSPTGNRIAFHRLVPTPGNGNGNGFRIHVADVDRVGGITAQQTFEFNDRSDDELGVQWLPSGEEIVFQRFDAGRDYLSIVRPETDAAARDLDLATTNGQIDTMRITVAPDGRQLFVHLLSDNTDWMVDLATGLATHLDIDGEDYVHIQRRAP